MSELYAHDVINHLAEPSLVHIGAKVSHRLITTCPCTKLSYKCSYSSVSYLAYSNILHFFVKICFFIFRFLEATSRRTMIFWTFRLPDTFCTATKWRARISRNFSINFRRGRIRSAGRPHTSPTSFKPAQTGMYLNRFEKNSKFLNRLKIRNMPITDRFVSCMEWTTSDLFYIKVRVTRCLDEKVTNILAKIAKLFATGNNNFF